jgi:hypothetical protein
MGEIQMETDNTEVIDVINMETLRASSAASEEIHETSVGHSPAEPDDDDEDEEAEVIEASITPPGESPQSAEDYVPDTQPLALVEAKVEVDSTKVRQRALELKGQMETAFIELCWLYRHIQLKQLYRNWGYTNFKEYSINELKLPPSKPLYLASIYKNLHEKQGPDVFEKVMSVGWSKAKDLHRVVTRENMDYWIQKASHLSVVSLIKEVKAELRKKIPDDPKDALEQESSVRGTPVEEEMKTITLSFDYNDYLAFSNACELIQSASPNLTKSQVIGLLSAEYLGGNSLQPDANADTKAKSQELAISMIQKIAKVFSLEVMALDSQKSFVHGYDLFKSMVESALNGNQETETELQTETKPEEVANGD